MSKAQNNDIHKLDTEEKLRCVYKKPQQAALRKQNNSISAPGKAMINASPMIMMATASDDGIDVSPKGDKAGFVKIMDDKTLLIPDRPGNNRIDWITNLIKNPQVGIIFLVPCNNTTYRVNGTAHVSNKPELLNQFLIKNKPPLSVIVVNVEEAFNHCPKAFIRAELWSEADIEQSKRSPNHGTFAAYRDGKDKTYAKRYVEDYKKRLPKELY